MKQQTATVLLLGTAILFTSAAVNCQTNSHPTGAGTAVSAQEVESFMRSVKESTNGFMAGWDLPSNPRRVPLLLAAILREPAGPWVDLLRTFCFGAERSNARHLAGPEHSEFYRQAAEYLGLARETVCRARQGHVQDPELDYNMRQLDQALALALLESGTGLGKAEALAKALLKDNTATNWDYGNIIYNMHSLLGRVALRKGDLATAKMHLREAAKTPGSPQLNSFGPHFDLAVALVARGQRAAVLEHLEQVAVFWANPDTGSSVYKDLALEHRKKLESWKDQICQGKVPTDSNWR